MGFFLLLVSVCLLLVSNYAQTCLESPPAITHGASGNDIEWTDLGSGVYATTITMTVCSLDISPGNVASFVTRCFDGMIPGYTIRMERGNTYNVTVQNLLGPENAANSALQINTPRNPNHTNIHTHGLHISSEAGGDDIFHEIGPGEEFTFSYRMPCNHAGGTMWYHPHVHGSTAVQAGGGAAGMMVVEDDADMEGLPSWLTSMEEFTLAIYYLDLPEVEDLFANSGADDLFRYVAGVGEATTFFVANGEYQPTICINSNQWYRFRISYAAIEEPLYATLTGCTLRLLAKDGVLLHGTDNTTPRTVNAMFFTTGTRADIAINCPYDGSNNPSTYSLTSEGGTVIAYFEVSGTSTTPTVPQTTLTTFNPIRPSYLIDLQSVDAPYHTFCGAAVGGDDDGPGGGGDGGDDDDGPGGGGGGGPGGKRRLLQTCSNFTSIDISPNSIFGVTFAGEDNYFFNVTVGEYVEFDINGGTGGGAHPFHMHVNHMQLVSTNNGGETQPTNWYEAGDYHDIIHGDSVMRWYADTYGGVVVMHCHILEHEDEGAMGTFYINGGCDAVDQDLDDTGTFPSCSIPVCETTNPTNMPSSNPSGEPSGAPTATRHPSNNPTTTPTSNPSGSPTLRPTDNPTFTRNPSRSPWLTPTFMPSMPPTVNPTQDPSTTPSQVPSDSPVTTTTTTLEPTIAPVESDDTDTTEFNFFLGFTFSASGITGTTTEIENTIESTIEDTIESETNTDVTVDVISIEINRRRLQTTSDYSVNASVVTTEDDYDTALDAVSADDFSTTLQQELITDLDDTSISITSDLTVTEGNAPATNSGGGNNNGMSGGVLAAIIICSLVGVAIIVGLGYWFIQRQNSNETKDRTTDSVRGDTQIEMENNNRNSTVTGNDDEKEGEYVTPTVE